MDSLIDLLTRPEVRTTIRENIHRDPNELILNPPSSFKSDIKAIASQIQARQKAKDKLREWADDFDLIMPPPLSIEQASSTVTSAYKRKLISGNHLVDLTGGMGIDCLGLSASFEKTTYVEQQADLCKVFDHNAKVLSKSIEIVNSTAQNYLERFPADPKHTVAYLDPARRDENKNKVFRVEDCSPDLAELLPLLRAKFSVVLVKFSPILDLTSILNQIPQIKELHVVSVKNECKELLLLMDFSFSGETAIKCVNLESHQSDYSFMLSEERMAKPTYAPYQRYLYEPNASIMKAGAFHKVSEDFDLIKIGEHTHFYTSDQHQSDFPGRVFEVKTMVDKQSLKNHAPEGKINVISRNHPLNATELKKKYKLKDGGNDFLLVFRDYKNKPQMIIGSRIDL